MLCLSFGWVKFRRITCFVLFLSLVAAPISATGASQQHQWGSAYLQWQGTIAGKYLSEPSVFISQEMTLIKKATKTFWAAGWLWEGESVGAYVGLQTSGSLNFAGGSQEIAIFSVWNATTARATSPQTVCKPFSGEGIGYSCRHPIPIETGQTYRFQTSTFADEFGQWVSASIELKEPKLEYQLGLILLPKRDLNAGSIYNFIEYFGEQRPCNEVQDSTALFQSPSIGDGRKLGFRSLSIPAQICANVAADSPPVGTPASVLLRFGGVSQQPSSTTTTTTVPTSSSTIPKRSLSGTRCPRVGAVRRVEKKTFICKATSKQLTWQIRN